MNGLALALLVSLGAGSGGPRAQEPDLAGVAAMARQAFLDHDYRQLLAGEPSIRLRLPNREASSPVPGRVAVAALEAFTRRDEEVDVSIRGAAVIQAQHGYVELVRRFRAMELPSEETQRVLLSVRFAGGRWRVVEVWVVQSP